MTTTVLLSRWPASRDASSSCESCCTLPLLSQRSRMASCCACSAALATTLPECNPHSFPVASSHHHLPSLSCWLGSTARVQGSQPMDTYPHACSSLVGTPCNPAYACLHDVPTDSDANFVVVSWECYESLQIRFRRDLYRDGSRGTHQNDVCLVGRTMTRRKFQTSWDETFERGLYLTREFWPPACPSNTGSTCSTGTAARVPGLWSFRCPVIHAFKPLSCRRRGRTCSKQHTSGTWSDRVSLPHYPTEIHSFALLIPGGMQPIENHQPAPSSIPSLQGKVHAGVMKG